MPDSKNNRPEIWPSVSIIALVIVAAVLMPHVTYPITIVVSVVVIVGIMILGNFQRRYWRRSEISGGTENLAGQMGKIGIILIAAAFLWHYGGYLLFAGLSANTRFWVTLSLAVVGCLLALWNTISSALHRT